MIEAPGSRPLMTALLLAALLLASPQTSHASSCSDFQQNPSGPWRDTCKQCSEWDGNNAGSVFQCPAKGNPIFHNGEDYDGCLNTAENNSGGSAIDISTCATCALVNINGLLGCEKVNVVIDVHVTYDSKADSASFTYRCNSGQSSNYLKRQVSSENHCKSISLLNQQQAKITYKTQLPDDWSATGLRFKSGTTSVPEYCVTGNQITFTEDGTSDQNYQFHLAVTDGKRIYESPDPTIVNKSEGGS